jgi:L-rhamnose mutarotase
MGTNYITEDGYYFSLEDLTQFALFKVQELRNQNKTNDEIIEFDDNQLWQEIVKNIITSSDKEHETNLQND